MGTAAARALARHPSPAALATLREVLRDGGEGAGRAADALAMRADPAACPDLKAAVAHPDATLRYHAVQAAGALGCLSREELERIAKTDADSDVRELAGRSSREPARTE